jgi:formylglycine-generating enzyme required for sulfatase activity
MDWILNDEADRRILYVMGPAGAGKTTALTRAALAAAIRYDNNLEALLVRLDKSLITECSDLRCERRFPLLLSCWALALTLAEKRDGGIETLIARQLSAFLCRAVSNEDVTGLFATPTILMLDSIEEIKDQRIEEKLDNLIMEAFIRYPNVRFIVTCRALPNQGTLARNTIDIELPSDSQRAKLITTYAKTSRYISVHVFEQTLKRWERGIRSISRQTSNDPNREPATNFENVGLLATPLMLTSACRLASSGADLPTGRTKLIGTLLDWVAKGRPGGEEGAKGQFTDRRMALQRLAAESINAPQALTLSDALDIVSELLAPKFANLEPRRTAALKLLDELEDIDAIQIAPPIFGSKIKFKLELLQSYLAAEYWSRAGRTEIMNLIPRFGRRLNEGAATTMLQMMPNLLMERGERQLARDVCFSILELSESERENELDLPGLLELALLILVESGSVLKGQEGEEFRRRAIRLLRRNAMAWKIGQRESLVSLFHSVGVFWPLLERPPGWVSILKGRVVDGAWTAPFEIWSTPVLVADYDSFVKASPEKDEALWPHAKSAEGRSTVVTRDPQLWSLQLRTPERPVTSVTWFEASAFCLWASRGAGPSSSSYGPGPIGLPTPRQWKLAATFLGAGTYPWGNEDPGKNEAARVNYTFARQGAATSVGVFTPIGGQEKVYDLGSNVQEWACSSRVEYRDSVERGATKRVEVLGGSWQSTPENLRVERPPIMPNPNLAAPFIGFRIVRSAE